MILLHCVYNKMFYLCTQIKQERTNYGSENRVYEDAWRG